MGRKELIVLFYTRKRKERFDLQKFFFIAL